MYYVLLQLLDEVSHLFYRLLSKWPACFLVASLRSRPNKSSMNVLRSPLLISLWMMTTLMAAPSFAQQTPLHEKRDASLGVEEFEAKDVKDLKDSKEPLQSQTSSLTKSNDSSEGNVASSCPDCAITSRATMTSEERRQLRRDIHEAGRKIYPRHPRNPSRHP